MKKTILAALGAAALLGATALTPASAATCAKMTHVELGVSIYVGWQPWYDADQTGLLKAEGAKRCLDIHVTQFPSYGPSIDAYTAGQVDALVITNMDTMLSPMSSGVDTTAVIVGDYSNGNDAILSKDVTSVRQLKGKIIYRAQNTVTDYLIERALEKNGMATKDVNLENLDDSAHQSTFESNDQVRNLGTWNPMTAALQEFSAPSINTPGNKPATLFTSASIPGEIQDLLVVNTKALKAHPEIGDAFAATWYKEMAAMVKGDQKALGTMASTASSTLPEYMGQLKTTHMYYSAADAAKFADSAEMQKITKAVRDFCYARGMMGTGATDPDAIGISFPDGTVLGNKTNVKFHYDATWMQKAAEGKLN